MQPKQPKLVKFGVVSEHEDGRLIFSGFHVEMNGASGLEITLLSLVIKRLEKELAEAYGNE